MGLFTPHRGQEAQRAEEARQAEAAQNQPERRRSLFVSPKRRSSVDDMPRDASTTEHKLTKTDHNKDSSKRGFFGTSLGGKGNTNSSLPRTGSDVQAAPGSALALAREHLHKAHEAEEDLIRALDRAKQSSRDAKQRVTELQDEAMAELKAAHAKSKEAKSLEKETRRLHH